MMKQVTALKRGLQVLRALNETGVSEVRDVHRITGLPKPTVVRMLETLCAEGYVRRNDRGGYGVTARVVSLSQGFDAAGGLLQVAEPLLARLRLEHAWPVELAVCDTDAMVVLGTGASPGTMSLNRPNGARLPILLTAMGRAYLAFCPDDERTRILDALRASDDPKNALARDEEAVARLIDETRRKGFAVNDRAHIPTTRAVAAPVMVGGAPVASVSMMVIASAMSMEQAEKEFVPPLRDVTRAIAGRLGGREKMVS